MYFTILKYALKTVKQANGYLNRNKDKLTESERSKKRKLDRYITLGILFVVVASCLFALSPFGALFPSSQTNQTTSSTQTKTVNGISSAAAQAAMNKLNDATMVRISGAASLTRYPDQTTNALSSAAVDEATGKQTYMHGAGQGGVALAAKNTSSNAATPNDASMTCQQAMQKVNSVHSGTSVPGVCGTGPDLFTNFDPGAKDDGWLFSIPLGLTSENANVTTFLNSMIWLALACLVPIIAYMGISYMTGRGQWQFANLLESIPRLLLAAVGVALAGVLADQLIIICNALCDGFMSMVNSVNTGANVTDLVMPSNEWVAWIAILMTIFILLSIAQALAPAAILGNTYGFIGAIVIIGVLNGLFIGLAPKWVATTLSMAVAAQTVMRVILVDLYIVLSPLAIVSAALPGQTGVKFARDWIMGFLSLLAAQFGVVVVIGIGMLILGQYNSEPHDDIVYEIIKWSILALILRTPSIFR